MDQSVALASGEATTAEVYLSGGRRAIVSVVPLFMAETLSRRKLEAEEIGKPDWPTWTEETADKLGQQKLVEWGKTSDEFREAYRLWKSRDDYWFDVAVTVLALRDQAKLPENDDWLDASGMHLLGLEIPGDPLEKLYWFIRATILITPEDHTIVSMTARALSQPTEQMIEEEVSGFFSNTMASLFKKRKPTAQPGGPLPGREQGAILASRQSAPGGIGET